MKNYRFHIRLNGQTIATASTFFGAVKRGREELRSAKKQNIKPEYARVTVKDQVSGAIKKVEGHRGEMAVYKKAKEEALRIREYGELKNKSTVGHGG